jgi:hypothetical protein
MKWEDIFRRWKRGWVVLKECEIVQEEVVAGTVVAHALMHQDLLLPLDRLKDPTAGIFPLQKKRPKPAAEKKETASPAKRKRAG